MMSGIPQLFFAQTAAESGCEPSPAAPCAHFDEWNRRRKRQLKESYWHLVVHYINVLLRNVNNICSWHHHSSELWHCNSSGFVLWLLLAPPSSYSHRFTVPPNTFPVLLADCCFWSYVLMSTPPARASTQPSIEPSSICSIYTHRYLLGCTYLLCTLYRNSTYPT